MDDKQHSLPDLPETPGVDLKNAPSLRSELVLMASTLDAQAEQHRATAARLHSTATGIRILLDRYPDE